eukprot:CAMPEP_0115139828 /NCGR_PEP_ID=MMETSP0227-20121206/58537_1 /TAXON_ID=89957 /ORGANISM="Polarella glacialis, Strain CCMP 1383" /LENGTH=155 /DNA_ID=CAMNT_0002547799 /DNA_START=219 /DNA_END=683 /DNA_ORIENTATION=-
MAKAIKRIINGPKHLVSPTGSQQVSACRLCVRPNLVPQFFWDSTASIADLDHHLPLVGTNDDVDWKGFQTWILSRPVANGGPSTILEELRHQAQEHIGQEGERNSLQRGRACVALDVNSDSAAVWVVTKILDCKAADLTWIASGVYDASARTCVT